ncbi:serine hydrolase [Bacillus mobilis]|uniref:serine hydrolase n=1 Tax=Bacillus mobilis TaxID=2026190 RepID=UPI0035D55775
MLAQDKKILLQGAYGEASVKTHAPMQLHQRFNLASVSKPIAAFGILLLVQENKIKLDDNITNGLQNYLMTNITVRHFLQHHRICQIIWNGLLIIETKQFLL